MPNELRYLAFDIETAAIVPEEETNWLRYRPLGISCAATLAADEAEPKVWYGKTASGSPAGRMQPQEAAQLVDYLASKAGEGYRILTWNGLAFDFDILAEESGAKDICKRLAWEHVDMMFHVFCNQGYRVALDKAAQGMGIPGKRKGMSGILAPQVWADGRYEEGLGYVGQDVRVALDLARQCERSGEFRWVTMKGSRQSFGLPKGWLAAKAAFLLSKPDTSWMSNPATREEFFAWMK